MDGYGALHDDVFQLLYGSWYFNGTRMVLAEEIGYGMSVCGYFYRLKAVCACLNSAISVNQK